MLIAHRLALTNIRQGILNKPGPTTASSAQPIRPGVTRRIGERHEHRQHEREVLDWTV